MARYSLFGMAGAGIAAAFGFVVVLGALGAQAPASPGGGPPMLPGLDNTGPLPYLVGSSQELKKFSSVEELKTFLLGVGSNQGELDLMAKERMAAQGPVSFETQAPAPAPGLPSARMDAQTAAPSYSTTNVQVEGIDEPDFLKNDGRYIYVLSGDRLTIIDAYPAKDARVIAKVALDVGQGRSLQDMFLSNDTLVTFYQLAGEQDIIPQYDYRPVPVFTQNTHALIIDISDRANPRTLHDFKITGSYKDARLVRSHVLLVTANDIYDFSNPAVPRVMEGDKTVAQPDLYYFDNPELHYAFNTVTAIDTIGHDIVDSETFMMNPSSSIYVSNDSMYIAYEKNLPYYYAQQSLSHDRFFKAVVPLLPQEVRDRIDSIESDGSLTPSQKWEKVSGFLQGAYNAMSESERNELFGKIQNAVSEYDATARLDGQSTVIHRLAIDKDGSVTYVAKGEVAGRLLNQFSMDEHDGRFRVATTSDSWSLKGGSSLYNNVYVMDMKMQVAGRLEGIAEGESIYSARFAGDRLYLVTFQRVDPFFVIDLSGDEPRVLGKLELPGYSSYLHPYDDTHILGIGRETADGKYGGVQVKGVKLALFDVADVTRPRLVDEYVIGGSSADSEVLYDHKALLFDGATGLLSLPVSIGADYGMESPDGKFAPSGMWTGFYVFQVDASNGFELKGRVEHPADSYFAAASSRSIYIGDVLYTVTLGNLVKMNNIADLSEINQIKLEPTGDVMQYPLPFEGGQGTTGSFPR